MYGDKSKNPHLHRWVSQELHHMLKWYAGEKASLCVLINENDQFHVLFPNIQMLSILRNTEASQEIATMLNRPI